MSIRRFRLAGTGALAVALMAPTIASAQYVGADPPRSQQSRNDHGRSRDGYGYERGPLAGYDDDRAMRRDRIPNRDVRRCDRGTGGNILGAIAGGLLGNAAVGRHSNGAAGTPAGRGNATGRDC